MDAENLNFVILLARLENIRGWRSEVELQKAIVDIIELVNTAADITGIVAAGLMVDRWGDDPMISFFVQHDDRWDEPEDADDMIVQTFNKAIELCKLSKEFTVLGYEEREKLDTEG